MVSQLITELDKLQGPMLVVYTVQNLTLLDEALRGPARSNVIDFVNNFHVSLIQIIRLGLPDNESRQAIISRLCPKSVLRTQASTHFGSLAEDEVTQLVSMTQGQDAFERLMLLTHSTGLTVAKLKQHLHDSELQANEVAFIHTSLVLGNDSQKDV